MRIACMMIIHERAAMTRVALQRLKRQTLPVDLVVVGSGAKDRELAEEVGVTLYADTPNRPLAKKYQFAVARARDIDPDYMLIMDSDDWITDDWTEKAVGVLQKTGVDLYCTNYWTICQMYKGKPWEMYHQTFNDIRRTRPIGSGRVFTRKILDKMGWVLWRSTQEHGLDLESHKSFLAAGGKHLLIPKWKSPNILLLRYDWDCDNPWAKLTGGLPGVVGPQYKGDPKKWIDYYYPDGVKTLEAMLDGCS